MHSFQTVNAATALRNRGAGGAGIFLYKNPTVGSPESNLILVEFRSVHCLLFIAIMSENGSADNSIIDLELSS